ncbi:MAG TPA: TetR/AcrR family transcriptional regulator [Gaiellaceae bacterium]|nr:TetR/AcrR family transcriptional regulator [Gaiellaceae bacterium]
MEAAPTRHTPRKPRSDGERSRRTILDAAAKLATVEGLEGLSIGRLAEHIGMSKSGLYAHFGSKEELQLAAIETASAIYQAEVVAPAEQVATPLEKLEVLCEQFLSHIERRVFPGGCFFASAAAEFDTHPGAVKERIADFQRGWTDLLVRLVREAQAAGQLRAEDPDQLVFELNGYLLMANTAFLLYGSPQPIERARRAVAARLEGRTS